MGITFESLLRCSILGCPPTIRTASTFAMLTIRIIRGAQFLRGNQRGALDLEASQDALCHLLAEGTDGTGGTAGDHDLLFDVREADIEMTLPEVWALVEGLKTCDPGFNSRLALLGRWDETYNRLEFLQENARLYGIDAKAFHDFESAVNWLWESRSLDTADGDPE